MTTLKGPDPYAEAEGRLAALFAAERELGALYEGVCRILNETVPTYNWVGIYLVDFGAVRDFGRSTPDSAFTNAADAPLVQIPGTGVIWKISRTGGRGR